MRISDGYKMLAEVLLSEVSKKPMEWRDKPESDWDAPFQPYERTEVVTA